MTHNPQLSLGGEIVTVQTFEADHQQWLDSINATSAAVAHIRQQLQKSQKAALRLSLKESGCTGFKYVIEEVAAATQGDLRKSLAEGVDLFIAPEHLSALKGLQIDYEKVGLNRNLVMNNPNVKDACGCGESFNV